MSAPYVEQGSIFLVPVLRQRLNFAVQVNRAVHELDLGEHDLVAVALPESARASTLEAVARLRGPRPRVSLVISSADTGDPREVFPVTPADGLVEAIRTAGERHVPLAFIDQEVAAGHLVDHFCLADDDWPDDQLALDKGSDHYLDLVAARLAYPPARYDPVDGWRELHMAAQLQRLVGRHRRILFVCTATHVRPIQQLLRRPLTLLDAAPSSLPAPRYTIREPSLLILLRYLDTVPRLVEAYERQRAQGEGHLFHKQTSLLQLLHDLSQASTDLHLSIRHYQAFAQILTRLLESEHRLSPDLDTVLRACTSCFSKVFAERAHRYLLGYFDQVKAERIGRVSGTGQAVLEVKATRTRNSLAVFVARNCTQLDHSFQLMGISGVLERAGRDDPISAPDMSPGIVVNLDAPRESVPRRRPGSEWRETWPPTDTFIADMRRKAFTLARLRADRLVKSQEFRGSLLDGVDFRRTLRSQFKRSPRLYVRQAVPQTLQRADRHEPVVWLSKGFEGANVREPNSFVEPTNCGSREDPRASRWQVLTETSQTHHEDRLRAPVRIYTYEVHGMVSFLEDQLTAEQMLALSPDRARRVPRSDALYELDDVIEWVFREYGLDLTPDRWWDVMLVAAMHYARETVVLVAPKWFVVPEDVQRRFAAHGKGIVRVSPAGFTPDEVRRLEVEYVLAHEYEPPGDTVDPQHLEFVTKHFGDLMRSYWE